MLCSPARHLALLVLAATGALLSTLSAQRVNLAKYQVATADSVSSGGSADLAFDGVVGNDSRWISALNSGTHWLRVEWPEDVEVGSLHIFSGLDDQFVITDFVLQTLQNTAWVDIAGTKRVGNTQSEIAIDLSTPLRTKSLRLLVTSGAARVKELAVYPPRRGGWPIGTDLTLNVVKEQLAVASTTLSGFPARQAIDGYVDDNSRWISESTAGPHTLDITLAWRTKIGGAHLYSGFGAQLGTQVRNGRLQSWSGTAWIDIPGARLTNNASFERTIRFTQPVTTDRVRLLIEDRGFARVRELVVFPARTAPYPLGTDATRAPRPKLSFSRFHDSYKMLSNTGRGRVLESKAGKFSFETADRGSAQQFQLLLNVGTDTYRIRNRETGWHLTVRGMSKAAGADVIEAPYAAMPHQLWRVTDAGGGTILLQNEWSRHVLDVQSTSAGDRLVQRIWTASATQKWRIVHVTHYPKKGLAGWEGFTSRFRGHWNYNWGQGSGKSFGKDINFAPMVWGNYGWGGLRSKKAKWQRASKQTFLMGFNEPDKRDQANFSVAKGLELWPRLERSHLPLVSPAPANPYSWLSSFMPSAAKRGYRVDYVGVHWYAAPNADSFMGWLWGLNQRYKRPLWITEFSCVDWSGNGNWDWLDNYTFFAEILHRFEQASYIRRYSVFLFTGSYRSKRSNIFANGQRDLTPIGRLYAAWDGDLSVRENQPYFVHNKGTHEHLRNPVTADTPQGVLPDNNDATVQWTLRKLASGNHVFESHFDGRRLGVAAGALRIFAPGTNGAAVEWALRADKHGWYFLDNVGSARRLRRVSGRFELVSTSTVWNSTRWRFILPYTATATPELYGTSCGKAGLGWYGLAQTATRFGLRVRDADPSAPAVFLLAAQRGALPLGGIGMSNCTLNLDLATLFPPLPAATDASGRAALDLWVPPGFRGAFRAQALFGERSLNTLGLGATRGLDVPVIR